MSWSKSFSIAIAFWLIFGSLSRAEQASPENMTQLRADIKAVKTEIQEAKEQDALYSGGLVKSLIALRLATLQHTLAMLEQREKSIVHGVKIQYTIDGKPYNAPADLQEQLARIREELRQSEEKIERQKAEVARYTGGLVLAMSLSTLATTRQSHAMLDQRRVALEYGIPIYVGTVNAGTDQAKANPTAESSAAQKVQEQDWEIVEIDSKVTESNTTWSKFAWKLTLRNKSDRPQVFDAIIEFQDKDGFVVNDDRGYGFSVPPNSEQVFTGYALIDAKVAGNVARINAKASKK